MSGWGLLVTLGIAVGGGLLFLSVVADDLQRANTDLDIRKSRREQARKERLEYEEAVRRAAAADQG